MSSEQVNRAKEAPDFIIDENNGALINTNNKGLAAYRVQRKQMLKMRTDADRLDKLETDIAQMKELLIRILNK